MCKSCPIEITYKFRFLVNNFLFFFQNDTPLTLSPIWHLLYKVGQLLFCEGIYLKGNVLIKNVLRDNCCFTIPFYNVWCMEPFYLWKGNNVYVILQYLAHFQSNQFIFWHTLVYTTLSTIDAQEPSKQQIACPQSIAAMLC